MTKAIRFGLHSTPIYGCDNFQESVTKIFQFCHDLAYFCHNLGYIFLIDILYQFTVTKMIPKCHKPKFNVMSSKREEGVKKLMQIYTFSDKSDKNVTKIKSFCHWFFVIVMYCFSRVENFNKAIVTKVTKIPYITCSSFHSLYFLNRTIFI